MPIRRFPRAFGALALGSILMLVLSSPVRADDQDAKYDALKKDMEQLRQMVTDRDKKIDELERKVSSLQPAFAPAPVAVTPGAASQPAAADKPSSQQSLDELLRQINGPQSAIPGASTDIWSKPVGSATIRLIDMSFDMEIAAGGSTAPAKEQTNLQGGGHDPRHRGFTLQQAELSAAGAVDPYFNGEAHIVYFIDPVTGNSEVELEEAYATSQALPWGLQVKAGQFLTEFGRVNPTHPHAWSWLDQPIINTRVFGPDGMRAPGGRVSWLTPLPWFSEVTAGIQNANGETMGSFLADDGFFGERPIGGRPFVSREVKTMGDLVYTGRWANAWNLTDEISAQQGVSIAAGPNASGPGGSTLIYGTDLVVKWRPKSNDGGWPYLTWETELIGRTYRADAFHGPGPDTILGNGDDLILTRDTLHDWGVYSQVLYGFTKNWAAGLRGDVVGGSGASVNMFAGRQADPFRDDRFRITPLVLWKPSEFTTFRLQFDYDHANHLARKDVYAVWLGMEILFGAHPAHKY